MSDRIWLIVSGHYSDYQVHAAAQTEADARAVIERLAMDDVRAERVPLVDATTRTYALHTVAVRIDKPDEEPYEYHEWSFDPWDCPPQGEVRQTGPSLIVESTDLGRARALFADRRARMLADREGS